jgi:hypothetical protein
LSLSTRHASYLQFFHFHSHLPLSFKHAVPCTVEAASLSDLKIILRLCTSFIVNVPVKQYPL